MARFYGSIQGCRGEATRLGGADSGLTAIAASWSGAVKAEFYADNEDRDCVIVSLIPWHGRGPSRTLYCGPIADAEKLA